MRKRNALIGLAAVAALLAVPTSSTASSSDKHVLKAWETDTQSRRPMGDFDGDGKADIAVWRPSNGTWYITRSSDGRQSTRQWGDPADIPVPGDYDCDGKTDIAVWRPSTGVWLIIRSRDNSTLAVQGGDPSMHDYPILGDWNGNHCADVATFHRFIPSDPYYWNYELNIWGDGLGWRPMHSSEPGPAPLLDIVSGDYDGDGWTDRGGWEPAAHWLTIIFSGPFGGWLHTPIGQDGDIPVVGDFDGDRKADPAVFRPGDSTFHIQPSGSGGAEITKTWVSGDPVVADYDGDGKADIATYINGLYRYTQSSNGDSIGHLVGQAGDVPV